MLITSARGGAAMVRIPTGNPREDPQPEPEGKMDVKDAIHGITASQNPVFPNFIPVSFLIIATKRLNHVPIQPV